VAPIEPAGAGMSFFGPVYSYIEAAGAPLAGWRSLQAAAERHVYRPSNALVA